MGNPLGDRSPTEEIQLDRRRASRRSLSENVQSDSRGADRRVRKPGFVGLVRDIFGFGAREKTDA
jgi:hypothetical protein